MEKIKTFSLDSDTIKLLDDYCAKNGVTQEDGIKTAVSLLTYKSSAPIKGQWKDGESKCPVCGEDKFKGLDADIWADWQPKFCPNCGARIDKGEFYKNVIRQNQSEQYKGGVL